MYVLISTSHGFLFTNVGIVSKSYLPFFILIPLRRKNVAKHEVKAELKQFYFTFLKLDIFKINNSHLSFILTFFIPIKMKFSNICVHFNSMLF